MAHPYFKTKALILALSIVTFHQPLLADQIDDWIEHKNPKLEPKIEYTGKPIQIKFSHPVPASSIVPPVWRVAHAWLEEATNGKIKIKEYGSGSLHGAAGGFKSVKSGISDYATCYAGFETRGMDLLKGFNLPFVAHENPFVTARIMAELAPKYISKEFNAKGTNYGYSSPSPPQDIMSKKPIRTLEDLKGMKIIAQGFSPEAAKALGFVTLNIPFPEIYTAFQQGIADAVIWFDAGFVPFKIYEIAKYHTKLGLYGGSLDTCFNRRTFKKLPPDLKQTFYDFQQRMSAIVIREFGVNAVAAAKKTYAEKGIVMSIMPEEERNRMKKLLEPFREKWIVEKEEKGIPAREFLADIERLKKKYDGATKEEMIRLALEDPVEGIVKF